ncbi:MAG: methyltransferase [Polyangiales bacterium]
MRPVAEDLRRALQVLLPAMDLVYARDPAPDAPDPCDARGWRGFLTDLDDAAVTYAESHGLAALLARASDAPRDLVDLARATAALRDLAPPLEAAPAATLTEPKVKARKGIQLDAMLHALRPMALRAARVVDVGAGSGHLTRLAAARFDTDALGVERDAGRVSFARALAAGTRARFEHRDALRAPLALRPDDLAVGLHACGALGDHLVVEAAAAGASVALVSCCLQKIPGETRAALSRTGRAAGLTLPRAVLGLSNVSERAEGVEATVAQNLAAREARHALAHLLAGRGVAVTAAEAMRGVNRRRAQQGLDALAHAVLAARGMSPPTGDELREARGAAARSFAVSRRLALPRSMLARALELTVVLDRATALAEAGRAVTVCEVFDPSVCPRNLGVFAG